MNTKIQYLETGVFLIDSWKPWITLSVIWGIHGNEPCGIELLKYIEKNLKITTWKIYGIYGNLNAIQQNTRQCDVNLNRIFRADIDLNGRERNSREYMHMKRIRKYLDLSDICLDIHSSPTKWSPVFAIGEENTFDLVKNFPVKYICSNFAQIEPGGTDYYMHTQWKMGICVECWYHFDTSAFIQAKDILNTFLIECDMISGKYSQNLNAPKYLKAQRAYITQTNDFRIIKNFSDFEEIQKWQILWYDSDAPIIAANNGYILFARNREEKWVEGFVELIKTRENE